ncbi:LOW QUALITY PROTEIN: hypothetical protein V2J09_000483 [Rumex salicifolius]
METFPGVSSLLEEFDRGILYSRTLFKQRSTQKPILVGGIELSHIFFADDLLLFVKALPDQVHIIKGCLDKFCSASGERVNHAKSYIFFDPTVNNPSKQVIYSALAMKVTDDIGKYLGVPTACVRRHLSNSRACPRCGLNETCTHALRDYSFVRDIWMRLGGRTSSPDFFSSNIKSWLTANLKDHNGWSTLFGNTIWYVWKHRNRVVFEQAQDDAARLVKCIWAASLEYITVNQGRRRALALQATTNVNRPVHWSPPPAGWVKLNVDACSRGNPGPATIGGILRSNSGDANLCFSGNVGSYSALRVELLAIHTGLQISRARAYLQLLLESDSEVAINLLNNELPATHPVSNSLMTVKRSSGIQLGLSNAPMCHATLITLRTSSTT